MKEHDNFSAIRMTVLLVTGFALIFLLVILVTGSGKHEALRRPAAEHVK